MAWCEEIDIVDRKDPILLGSSETQKRKRIKDNFDDIVSRQRAKLKKTQLSECGVEGDSRVSHEELSGLRKTTDTHLVMCSFTRDGGPRVLHIDCECNSMCHLSKNSSLHKKLQVGESLSQSTDSYQSDTTIQDNGESLDPMFAVTSTRMNHHTSEAPPDSARTTRAEIRGAFQSIFTSLSKIEQAVQAMVTSQGNRGIFPGPLEESELDRILQDLQNEVGTAQNSNRSSLPESQPDHEPERDMDLNEEIVESEDVSSSTKPPSPPGRKRIPVQCRSTVVPLFNRTQPIDNGSCDDENGKIDVDKWTEAGEDSERDEETEDGSFSKPTKYNTRSRMQIYRTRARLHFLSLFYPGDRAKPIKHLCWNKFGRMLVTREKRLTNWPHNVPYTSKFFMQSLSARAFRILCHVQIEDWTKEEKILFRTRAGRAEVNLIVSDNDDEPILTTLNTC